MKHFLTITFLVLYINSNTEFHELLRLPMLLEHYGEHKQKAEDLSFWDFLVMHYKTDVTHDDQDNKLPFKNPAHSFVAPTLTLCAQKLFVFETSPLAEVQHSSIYCVAFIASPLSEIFQPPRLG